MPILLSSHHTKNLDSSSQSPPWRHVVAVDALEPSLPQADQTWLPQPLLQSQMQVLQPWLPWRPCSGCSTAFLICLGIQTKPVSLGKYSLQLFCFLKWWMLLSYTVYSWILDRGGVVGPALAFQEAPHNTMFSLGEHKVSRVVLSLFFLYTRCLIW